MRSSRRSLVVSGLVVWLVALSVALTAPLGFRRDVRAQTPRPSPSSTTAQQADPSQQPPVFRGGANFVRVDAYVTEAGRPVSDLKAEDFEILEDGAAQSIQTFEHIVVRPAGPQASRVEPRSAQEANAM